jgi:hypothetical protein
VVTRFNAPDRKVRGVFQRFFMETRRKNMDYNFSEIEKKWQKKWMDEKTFGSFTA